MVSTLARVENVNICIDEKSLTDAGIQARDVGPLDISDVTLRSALHVLLAPHGLAYVKRSDAIVVTNRDEADGDDSWVIQPVHEVMQIDAEWPDYDALIELISMVSPQTWSEGTGPAPLTPAWGCLIFKQTSEARREIGNLVDALKRIKNRDVENLDAIRVGSPVDLKFAERMNKTLDESVDLSLDDVSLTDFVELLRHRFKLPIRLDERALDDASIRLADSRVSLKLRQIPLRDFISVALAPFELTTYLEFEQVWLSTLDTGETKTHFEVYPASDFLSAEDKQVDRTTRSLLEPLTRYLLPKTWAGQGGPCSASCYLPLRCLVVSQTEHGHAEVAKYLQTLRELRATTSQSAAPSAAAPIPSPVK
jgi:hypothetical protein